MSFWPSNLTDWVDVVTKVLATLFAVIGGGWGLYQYFKSSRLRAAETLLKMEEEFRNVCPIYEVIEDVPSYQKLIRPVLIAEREGKLDDDGLKKLTQLDRCLRFLYLCSVLNEALRVDRTLGVKGGALSRAYYFYIAILLPEHMQDRPELSAYTQLYYPLLTAWVREHTRDLSTARKPSEPGLTAKALPAATTPAAAGDDIRDKSQAVSSGR